MMLFASYLYRLRIYQSFGRPSDVAYLRIRLLNGALDSISYIVTDKNRYPTVIQAERGEHSAKPQIVYEMIETMYPHRRYLELFSRNQREGWEMWGLEAPKQDFEVMS